MRQIDNKIYYDSLCSDERDRLRHKGPTPPPPVLGQRSVSQRDGASPAKSVSVVTRVTAMSLSHHQLKFLEVSLWPHWLVSC